MKKICNYSNSYIAVTKIMKKVCNQIYGCKLVANSCKPSQIIFKFATGNFGCKYQVATERIFASA